MHASPVGNSQRPLNVPSSKRSRKVHVLLTRTVLLNDVVEILVAPAAEVDEDRARVHLLGATHGVGDRMGAFERGDDSLVARKFEECADRFFVGRRIVLDAPNLAQKGVLRSDGWVVESACYRIHRSRLARRVLEHDAVKAVHDALLAIRHGRRMIAELLAKPQRLDADDLHGIVEERHEHADGIAAAAHARRHDIGQETHHVLELLTRLDADDGLEVAHHHREGMRPDGRADAVDRLLVVRQIILKSRIDRLLERLRAARDGHDLRAEHLHARHIRRLLLDVDFAHVDRAVKPEEGRRRRKRHAVLSRARLRNDALLAHELRQKAFAHAVIELVCARMIQVLALQIDLAVADLARKSLAVIDGRRAALKLTAYAPKLIDELRGVADRPICLVDLLEGRHELLRQIGAAELAETPFLVRIFLEITLEFHKFSSLHLIQFVDERRCRFVASEAAHDRLRTEHDDIAIHIGLLLRVSVVVCRRQIALHEVGTFSARHAFGRSRSHEFLALDIDGAVLDLDVAAAVLLDALHVLVTALLVRRVIGRVEHLAGEILRIVALLLHEPLPDGGRGSRIVAGVRDVLEGEPVRFPFVRTTDRHLVDLLDDGTEHDVPSFRGIRHAGKNLCANRDIDLLAPGVRHMALHAMPHLMSQNDGDLVLVLQIVKEPAVDRHHMPERAEGIEAVLLIDEPQERLLVNGWVTLGNARRHAVNRTRAEAFPGRILLNAVLFLEHRQKLLASLLRLIELLDLLFRLSLCLETADNRADHVAPARISRWRRLHGETSPEGEHTRGESHRHTPLPKIPLHNHPPCIYKADEAWSALRLFLNLLRRYSSEILFPAKKQDLRTPLQKLRRKSLSFFFLEDSALSSACCAPSAPGSGWKSRTGDAGDRLRSPRGSRRFCRNGCTPRIRNRHRPAR